MTSSDQRRLKERALRAIADALQPLGFQRTKPTWYVRLRDDVAEFVHLHKFTFGPYFRVHVGIRVLNSPSDSLALNGPDSDSVQAWSPLPTGVRKYNIEYEDSEPSIKKCASTVRRFVANEGERWFSKWRDREKLATHTKSPLHTDYRQALAEALELHGGAQVGHTSPNALNPPPRLGPYKVGATKWMPKIAKRSST